jgi:hypothetical protein
MFAGTGTTLPPVSQLIPMIGITTSEQGTVSEQPSEALETAVDTTNWADPTPFKSLLAYVVLLGWRDCSKLTASGGRPAQPSGPPG